jgi:HTH-type transcriptional regulator/antitoxin HigA
MTQPIFPTEADYQAALREASDFFDREPDQGSPEADRFEALVAAIAAHEEALFPIALPEPADAIAFRMDQAGLAFADLCRVLGSPDAAAEILSRTRLPTLSEARALHRHFGIPADSLCPAPGAHGSTGADHHGNF